MARHVIRIHEHIAAETVPADTDHGRYCEVTISIDKKHRNEVRRVDGQFAGAKLHWIGKYLEHGLHDSELPHHPCVVYIIEYQMKLLQSLGISEDIGGFGESDVEIRVFPNSALYESRTSPVRRMSILEFYWELLEFVPDERSLKSFRKLQGSRNIPFEFLHASVWPSKTLVSVCRVVPPRPLSSTIRLSTEAPKVDIQHDQSSETGGARCRILLVIARQIRKSGKYEISPSYIEIALLKLFEELNAEIGWDFYELEVVRPGSFKELGRHLARRERYDMVHFDMHGRVLCQKNGCGKPRGGWQSQNNENRKTYCFAKGEGHTGRAFLVFSKLGNNGNLSLSTHPASDIALLLRRYQVRSVALNACESARANEGSNGNLSFTFLRYGISNVVAMSFQIADITFVKYFESYYRALFRTKLEPKNFLSAASHARKALRDNPGRPHYGLGNVDMYDWFVPVLYCDGQLEPLPFPQPDRQLIVNRQTKVERERRHLRTVQQITYAVLFIVSTAVLSRWAFMLVQPQDQYQAYVRKVLWLLMETAILYSCCKLSRAALCMRFVRYPAAGEIKSAILDINMLSIESELISKRSLILHGLANMPNTLSLVDSLVYVWDRTGFIEVVVIIPSRWFYQPSFVRKIRQWCCSFGHRAACCHGESRSWHPHSAARTAVIITDLEEIFPQQPLTQLSLLQNLLLASARRRFVRYLAENFKDRKKGSNRTKAASVVSLKGRRFDKPFLFLTGNAKLEDKVTLKASLDRLNVIGLNSTEFRQVEDYWSRTASIEDMLNPGKSMAR